MMRRTIAMLLLLLALGLCTSVLVAWAGALVDRTLWPDTPLTGTPTGTRTEMRGWLVEEGRDRTLTWRTFDALDLWDEPPDLEASTELPAWSVGHGLPDQPGPLAPMSERSPDMAWELIAGWPFRCVRAVRGPGSMGYALAGADLEGGLVAIPVEWPLPYATLPAHRTPPVYPWPLDDLPTAVPFAPLYPGIVADTILFALVWFTLALVLAVPGVLRRRWRTKRNHCFSCAHPRDGLPEGAPCPECGRDVPERRSFFVVACGRAPMVGVALALVVVAGATTTLVVQRCLVVQRLPWATSGPSSDCWVRGPLSTPWPVLA